MAQVLGPVQDHVAASHPNLLVGMAAGDDAGVYALGDGRALVQTVDIFTPVVDTPRDWGRIAAANALSDVYAMGATPVTALQYIAWPRDAIPFDVASQVTAGGMDVMASARCTVVGGHSIDGPEPTYGFAVTGMVVIDEMVANSGALPGHSLVLTKPLGMGIVTTAIKRDRCPPELAGLAIESMATLNERAGVEMRSHNASAATDVTGFGLLGHLREMCLASETGAVIELESVPVLEGVHDLLAEGMWAGGSQRNLEWIEPHLVTERPVEEWKPLVDAQTSGGLLVALPEVDADSYVAKVPGAVRIGGITTDKAIQLT